MKKYMSTLSSDGATLAKVIATFCVVLTHAYKIFGYLGVPGTEVFYLRGFHAIAACGVPVFFLLSGYFLTFKDNFDYQKNLKKKVKSLAIPYCCFMLLYALISGVGSLALPEFFDDFRQFTAYDWLIHLFGIPFVEDPHYYGPLWFVRELFIYNALAFALVPAVKKTPGFILIIAVITVYFLPIPQKTSYSVAFFVTGMFLGIKKRIPNMNNTVQIITVFAIGFTVPVAFAGVLSWKISVLLMAASILMLSGKLIERDSVKRMARIAIPYSFPIYLLHEYPMTAMMRLLALKHISLPAAVAAFFIAPFVVITMCTGVIILWKRFSPKSYAVCTGGR